MPLKLLHFCPAPDLQTALSVMPPPPNLTFTLSPQSCQYSKIIFFPDNKSHLLRLKNPLDIAKYLSLKDSQAVLVSLWDSEIFFPNRRESNH